MNHDIIIIGAGVTGCAIARELSKRNHTVAVLEKASDVCEGTSKANSGICHAGFDAAEGTLKAKLNVRGNHRMEALSKELDFPFKRIGALVVCQRTEDIPKLQKLYERGIKNGVEKLQVIDKEKLQEMEPNLTEEAVCALYAPTAGIVCPFGMTIAFAENAAENGVEFYLQTEVTAIRKEEIYHLDTNRGEFTASVVINAAGVYADVLHHMVSNEKMSITARKGVYCLFDKEVGSFVSHTVFQLPTEKGKGILLTPTTHGNLLVGPNANDTEDKEDIATDAAGLAEVLEKSKMNFKALPVRKVITSFAGLRAHEEDGDFIIREAKDAKGWIDVAGIESPGLSCAPAIGEYVAALVQEIAPAKEKEIFIANRKGIRSMATAEDAVKKQWIEENPAFANVICRCETVTEGEILEAIHRPLGATTVDGIKRRTRAGMGRCQSGFCLPKTMDILARELSVSKERIVKASEKSGFLVNPENGNGYGCGHENKSKDSCESRCGKEGGHEKDL